MASQFGILGKRRTTGGQVNALNARLSRLPQLIANQQRAEDIERETRYQSATLSQARREQRVAERAAQVGTGLEAGKLGFTVSNQYGNKSLGDLMGGRFGTGPGSVFGGINIGSGLSGALAGYSAGQMIGGKNKWKKSLAGGTTGALLGLLGGGPSGAISGGIGGAIGGLF
jgi:hypothetical protein